MAKGGLNTPFQNAHPKTDTSPAKGVVGHHPVASVGQKADLGPGDIGLKFAEEMEPGKSALSSPFQKGLGIANDKAQSTPQHGSGGLSTPFERAIGKKK